MNLGRHCQELPTGKPHTPISCDVVMGEQERKGLWGLVPG